MQDAEFDQIVNDLLDGTPPRVWSLLVTMFGDLAVAPEARLSGTTVNALTATIGIKPEATRVALHRLRKEEWIDSHRIGRQSRYGLTGKGRAETNAAWCRVYGPDPADTQVFLVTEDPAATANAPTKTAVSLSPRLWMSDSSPRASSHWAIPLPVASPVPRWVSEKLCPPEVQAASQTLNRRFTMLCEDTDFARLTLLQATALRMLVVHEWRRLILRVPTFPEALFSGGWHGAACRAHLSGMLTKLPVPNLAHLHHAIDADQV
ncbi:PaaX family transcriptional regulator C-terminal domain-containing protein [uncultured Marivita sp.]|uniref:PaaX family transcriptional regulator C-terminal domain-containing protein n=1 Tax=uncultured Marivita sp. TaxID=888080 RepID=UPI0026320D39|nr:PaaX family transcriptional regulator C-terminal domain-containing protein [uncultured Marivita sp.]